MLLSRTLFGLASLTGLAFAEDDQPQDLGTVLSSHKNLTKYYELIKKYPDVLLQLPNYSGVTIVAPSDAAFDNIPYTSLNGIWKPDDKKATVPLLQYHILQGTVSTGAIESGPTYVKSTLLTDSKYTNVTSGQNVLVTKQPEDIIVFTTSMGTRCTQVEGDIRFQGGLIQIVDNLLIPPAALGKTSDAFKIPSFLGGLYQSNLMPEVAERKNVTIFAPANKAFQAIGGGLENMTAEELGRVMGYHVIPNEVIVSSSFKNGTRLETLAMDASNTTQQSVFVRKEGNNLYINSAQIIQPDILIANGILHLISNVLNPDAPAVQPNPEIGTQPPVFPLSTATDVPFTSALPCTTNCPVTTTAGDDISPEATASATSTSVRSRSSEGVAAARCTGHVAGAALGIMGLGAGMAWL